MPAIVFSPDEVERAEVPAERLFHTCKVIGYTPYVVSTRQRPKNPEAWMLLLEEEGRIFFPDPVSYATWTYRQLNAWKKLLTALRIPWPTNKEVGSEGEDQKPTESMTAVMEWIRREHRVAVHSKDAAIRATLQTLI